MQSEILRIISLPDIPSASGIEIAGPDIYIIGDDSPYLFILDSDFQIRKKVLLFKPVELREGRIPKSIKPDLESLASFIWKKKKYLLALGSGSLKPVRDTAFLIDEADHSVKEISLTYWYDHFRDFLLRKNGGELNLEGAVEYNGKLYLFQRGNITGMNFIFSMPVEELFLHNKDQRLFFEAWEIHLPSVDYHHTGFSGACLLDESGNAVFSCTIEDTANVYDDGALMESRIGILNLNQHNVIPQTTVLQYNGKPRVTKLESLAVLKQGQQRLMMIGVCDNDAAGSELIEIRIDW